MKPITTIVVILLIIISMAHLLRPVFQVEIIAAGFYIPVWLSIFGVIMPAILALMLWQENSVEIIKTKLIPLKIIRIKDNQKYDQ